jgi:hypothetical protein
MRIRLCIVIALLAACGHVRADDGNAPAGRNVRLGEHPYALRVPARLADANDLATDANVLLALRDDRITLRVFSPPRNERATVLTVAKWYRNQLAERIPSARRTHMNWLTIEESNALYRQATAIVDDKPREIHALLFVHDGTDLVIEGMGPPKQTGRIQRTLLSIHRLAEKEGKWVPIGKTGYRLAPPEGWKTGAARNGHLRFTAPGGKVVLDVHARSLGEGDPNRMVTVLAAAFRKEMDNADGSWKLAARQTLDRGSLRGRLQYFLGRPDGVATDLVVLHAAGGDHVFTLTAALPAGVRKQFAKEIIAAMMSLRNGPRPGESGFRKMTVRRAGLQLEIPETWSTDDAGHIVKAIAPTGSPAEGTVLTVQVQPRSAKASEDLATATKAFRAEMKEADGRILADSGAKVAGLPAHLFEAVTKIEGKRYRVNYLYLQRDETICLVSYFTPEGRYTETRPLFIKALRSLRSFKPSRPRTDAEDSDGE